MDSFYSYYNKRSKDELIEKLRLFFLQQNYLEDRLAEVLGYPFSQEFGYAIGDHTIESLLEELIKREKEGQNAAFTRDIENKK